MKTEHKLYAAVAVLIILAGAVYYSQKTEKQQAASRSAPVASAELPKLTLTKELVAEITRLEIKNKDKGEVTLEKLPEPAGSKDDAAKGDAGAAKDDGKKDDPAAESPEDELPDDLEGEDGKESKRTGHWKLAKPVDADANQANVKSLLDALEKFEVAELITKSPDAYAKYELEGDKAVHVVAYKGEEKVLDMFFGKTGGRGQLARITGQEGVYAIKGYQSFVFAREIKNWRNTEVWKFEDKNVVGVEIDNDTGKFSFSKNEDKWSASFYKREEGKLAAKASKWEKFDPKKVDDMLRSYKTLRATDFAEKDADTGLEDPAKNGGAIRLTFKDDAPARALEVGKKSKNDDRFARVAGGDGTIYVLSSWTAKWAVAKQSDFEKPEEKKDDKKKDDGDDAVDLGDLGGLGAD